MAPTTRQRLLESGMELLLLRGYHDLSIHTLLEKTGIPKGSFYHHFPSKEAFGLACVDLYMEEVHGALDHFLGDTSRPPLARVRGFFEAVAEKYRGEGYLGCMLGGLGQELSGVSEVFRARVELCFSQIAGRLGACLAEAQRQGELAAGVDPNELANLLVNCWEGAALRSRLHQDPAPLRAMIEFYFRGAAAR